MHKSASTPQMTPESSRGSLHHAPELEAFTRVASGAAAPARPAVPERSVADVDPTPRPSLVRVVVRFRPPVTSEDTTSAFVADACDRVRSADYQQFFHFDHVFDQDAGQVEIYENVGRPMVEDVLEGYHGTILAYGQTGSGKTYSMFGPEGGHPTELQGLVPRAARDIFDRLGHDEKSGGAEFIVHCSFLEIYCEQLRDLLKPPKNQTTLQVREIPKCGFHVDGLTQRTVSGASEAMQILRAGLRLRASGNNAINQHSSRSHAIFTLSVQHRPKGADGLERYCKLTLVDLAGSEKVRKSGSTGEMLEEAKKINSSLSALGNVIDALADRRPHVPYRDSRLTRILEDSLGGNCRTTLLVACSPTMAQSSETLSSLRFAARAKKVCNYVRLNTGPNVTFADRQLLHRISQLQKDLASAHQDLEKRFASGCLPPGAVPSPRPQSVRRGTLSRSQTAGSLSIADVEHRGLAKSASLRSTSSFASGKSAGLDRQKSPIWGLGSATVPEYNFCEADEVGEWGAESPADAVSLVAVCASLQANLSNKGASREDASALAGNVPPELASRADDFNDDVIWPKQQHGERHQVFNFSNGGGRSGSLPLGSAMSTVTGSAGSSSGSAGFGHSHSSASLALPSSSATPISSWRNLDDDDGPRRRLSWLVEATPLTDDAIWFQKQLQLERQRCAALSDELEKRAREAQLLQLELDHSRAMASYSNLRAALDQTSGASVAAVHAATPVSQTLTPALSGQHSASVARLRSTSPLPLQLGAPRVVSCWAGPAIPTGARRSISATRRQARTGTPLRSSSAGRRNQHYAAALGFGSHVGSPRAVTAAATSPVSASKNVSADVSPYNSGAAFGNISMSGPAANSITPTTSPVAASAGQHSFLPVATSTAGLVDVGAIPVPGAGATSWQPAPLVVARDTLPNPESTVSSALPLTTDVEGNTHLDVRSGLERLDRRAVPAAAVLGHASCADARLRGNWASGGQ